MNAVTCYYPLAGFWSEERYRWLPGVPSTGEAGVPMSVPCGQCTGCRLERSRQWAVRCEHEISLHERNCFITLTYDDDNLPVDESVSIRTMQLFIKRLRKRYSERIKYLYCGEYGEENLRPHYHAMLFNCDFNDRKVFKRLKSGFTIDTSAILTELWPFGFSSVGSATFESAQYCASYCLKKVTGDRAEAHYRRITRYGEEVDVTPEFARMSQGLGLSWLDKFESDVYPADRVVSRGGRVGRPPRYYEKKFAARWPRVHEDIKSRRLESGEAEAWNNTPERLAVREQVQLARLAQNGRSL